MSDADASRSEGENGIRSKQRQFGKRPVRPDFAVRDEKLKTLQAKAREYSDLAKAKGAELEALQNENKASNRLESLKAGLANAQHSRVQSQKLYDMTKKRLSDMNNPKAVKGPQVKGIESSMGPQDILSRMEQLKERVSQEPDQDEANRIIARIQALNASYVQLMGTDAGTGPSNGAGGSVKASLEADLQKYDADLRSAQAKEDETRGQLEELRGKLDEAQPHIERLKKERETCLDVARRVRDAVASINAEWQEKFDTYKSQMDAWAEERDEVMKERNEQRKQEQAEREAERVRREKEARGPPYRDQIVACEQVLAWCKQYTQTAATPQGSTPAAAQGNSDGPGPSDGDAAPAGFEGMVMRGKKADENGDALATSRTKSKNKGRRPGRSPADGRGATAKINHDMDMLALFSKLKLSVPTSPADVPPLAETIAARKRSYEEKQRKALESGEEPVEEEAATPTVAAQERGAAGADSGAHAQNGAASGPVSLSLRCDEAFGTVLVELLAH